MRVSCQVGEVTVWAFPDLGVVESSLVAHVSHALTGVSNPNPVSFALRCAGALPSAELSGLQVGNQLNFERLLIPQVGTLCRSVV